MDKELLLYYVRKAGKSRKDLAQALGVSLKTIDNKIAGTSEFAASQIVQFARFCGIGGAEVIKIFFADIVE